MELRKTIVFDAKTSSRCRWILIWNTTYQLARRRLPDAWVYEVSGGKAAV